MLWYLHMRASFTDHQTNAVGTVAKQLQSSCHENFTKQFVQNNHGAFLFNTSFGKLY